jgi:uridine kinase
VILLIDGRSGSGKSELASALADTAQIVRLDDVYPGWDGLAAGSALVASIIGERRYRRWDWAAQQYAEWHELDGRPLVVEGCGALSRANRSLADFGIWVEHPAADRRRRALAREPGFAPHWASWAAQEQEFIERERPRERADAEVDGSDVTVDVERWRRILDPARVGE